MISSVCPKEHIFSESFVPFGQGNLISINVTESLETLTFENLYGWNYLGRRNRDFTIGSS
jgi:hypothetical protein